MIGFFCVSYAEPSDMTYTSIDIGLFDHELLKRHKRRISDESLIYAFLYAGRRTCFFNNT